MGMNRIGFLGGWAAAAAAALIPARVFGIDLRRRALWLRYDDGQEVNAYFTVDGHSIYRPGYDELCWLLRDRHVPWREGYVDIDIVEIEVLWEVQQTLFMRGVREPFVVSSGYRTPQTNATIEGAVRNSQHCYGRAVDMWVPGMSMRDLFNACWARERAGGVGYYDDHIHLDSGARRWWTE